MDPHSLCEQFLHWHRPRPSHEVFAELARYAKSKGLEPDTYGSGRFLNEFEQEIADLLGKESGLFVISGVMAQQIALRIWCEHQRNRTVAFHATSHLERNEQRAYSVLQGLDGRLIGDPFAPILVKHVQTFPERLSALLVELPLRHLGGVLPSWEQLGALKMYCRERAIRLHLDGARLWECLPFYDKSYREICEGFDSVYVSFYKGLGALSGAMLVGPKDFIEEARVWLRRMGGNLYQLHPYVVSAKYHLEKNHNIFADLHDKAQVLAKDLQAIPGIQAVPARPHTNMMHVLCKGTAEQLNEAKEQIAREDKVWLAARFHDTDSLVWARAEIYMTRDALYIPNDRALALFNKLMRLASA